MKNWKTTLLGILAGAALAYANAAQAKSVNPNAPAVTFGNLTPGFIIAGLGAVAKDSDVTGGTR